MLVVVLAVASASVASAQSPGASEPAATVRWLPSCAPGQQRTYFSVEVFEDGHARYTGGAQTREKGEKTVQLGQRDARRLRLWASDFTRGRSSPFHQPKNGLPPDACVEVASGSGATHRVRRESIEVRTGATLTDNIASVVPLRAWACPGRSVVNDAELKIASICGRWDGTPRIAADFGDGKSCPSYHEVVIYDDGTLYYAAFERNPDVRIAGDAYYKLSRQSLAQLEKMLAAFNLQQTHFDEPHRPRRDDSAFNTSNPREVAQFRDALKQLAGAHWLPMSGAGGTRCEVPAYLSVRANAWRRLKR
jgi:hypothetical protein